MDFTKDYILSINLFTPLIGVFLILIISILGQYGKRKSHIQYNRLNVFGENWALIIAIIFSAAPLILTSILLYTPDLIFGEVSINFIAKERFMWLDNLKINYSLMADGLSLVFILLTEALTIISIIVYWRVRNNYRGSPVLAMIFMLLLEVSCLGVFLANDLLLFYIFFEASLIPMLFIIGIWGREERVYASMKLFIYTVFGSVLFLLAILYLKSVFGTSEISELKLVIDQLAPSVQKYLWIGMFIAFAIKVPMLPFHTWLPDAHVQAPTFGSMMLAGILIKMGAFAMIKFLIPLFPQISIEYSSFVAFLSVIGIIYGSLLALAQTDMKKLIAYSSVAHMGYVTLGIFVPCGIGYTGAVFQMISHAFISSALFMSVGFIYERLHTLEIAKIHSLATRMKFFSVMFMIFTMGSVGLPGTSGFIGEFLTIVSAISRSVYFIYGLLAATGIIFGAIYMLVLYKKVFMNHIDGEIGDGIAESVDLKTNKLENTILIIFACAVIYFGIQPMRIIEKIQNVDINSYSNCNIKNNIDTLNNQRG